MLFGKQIQMHYHCTENASFVQTLIWYEEKYLNYFLC